MGRAPYKSPKEGGECFFMRLRYQVYLQHHNVAEMCMPPYCLIMHMSHIHGTISIKNLSY